MTITLAIDELLLDRANRNADAMGTSLDQLLRDYIQRVAGRQVAGIEERKRLAEEFDRLSGLGDSGDWRFNRDELHDRT
jgi:antitoxin component of RelBE/YafQ-DinJ toxin-antitoxin module